MPDAVTAAEAGTQQWRDTLHFQQAATPTADHGDLYALCGELVGTLRALERMAGVLSDQVARYGEGRQLRDDEGQDPADRLARASERLAHSCGWLDQAQVAVTDAWSTIGHVGLAYPATVETGEG